MITDNNKLLTDTNNKEMMNPADIKRSESVFASTWMKMHHDFENMKKEDEEQNTDDKLKTEAKEYIGKKKKDKSKSGKQEKLEDKVTSADIKRWLEHKRDAASFMEFLKTLYPDKSGEDIKYSFGELVSRPESIPKDLDILGLMEGDLVNLKCEESVKNAIETYGNQMVETYIKKVNFYLI
jgi:hypothetical protein